MAAILNVLKRFLEHRYLPVVLAVGAILVMLPALKVGLAWDDLVQRAVELKPGQLPPRMAETGNPVDSGSFSTVLRDLFGFSRDPQNLAVMKNYGTLPWWTPNNFRFALWRPVTAFTHWLDYRLFPDSPMLMHAHNIAWFAAVVFLVTVMYRKLMGPAPVFGGARLPTSRLAGTLAPPDVTTSGPGWAAGLAALLFLLDVNTYFPVAFVANRGFFLSLFFGLLCLYEHHQWRSAKSRSGCMLSALFLAFSLLADEGGASTLAFILAYALVLDPGPFRYRALTILPSILIIVLWRIVYTLSGFGVFHMGLYIDPANEPLEFGREVIPRTMVLLGSQLAGLAPDVSLALSPLWQQKLTAFYCVLALAAFVVFLPWVRRDKTAAFWFAVMVLAAIPAATVMPMSKNLGFVAVGAYGLIAGFVAALVTRPSPSSSRMGDSGAMNRLPGRLTYRVLAWIACGLLILAHVPGAVAGRVAVAKAVPFFLDRLTRLNDLGDWPNIENENVIIVNPPLPIACSFAPFYRAYQHQSLPRTLRALVPCCTSFDVQRTDDKTLVIQSKAPNIFSCDDVGPIHGAYLVKTANLFLWKPKCKKGDRYDLSGLTVEVLESDASDLPSRVAFRFDTSLDSPHFHWLQFDWRTRSYQPFQPFKIPAIGQSITLPGPDR